ncbi:unnamed protein product [Prunus brigantina]
MVRELTILQANYWKSNVLTSTRPDIMHDVSLISCYMENPTGMHLKVV